MHVRIRRTQVTHSRENTARVEADIHCERLVDCHADRARGRVAFCDQHDLVVCADLAEQIRRALLFHAFVEAFRAVRGDLLQADEPSIVAVLIHRHEHRAVRVETHAFGRDVFAVKIAGLAILRCTVPLIARAVRGELRLTRVTLGLLAVGGFLPASGLSEHFLTHRRTAPLESLGARIFDADRRDTLSLRSVVRYDRNAKRPSTPILVGKYVVGRRPITDSLHTLYLILDEGDIAGTQISIPSEDDCAQAVKRLRDKKRTAAKTASMTIRKAKKRGNGQRQTARETV